MAAPTYASDLTTINDGSGTFTEPTGATLGTLSNADTDNFIQGTTCSSKATGASGAPALAGIGILAGAGQTINTPSAYYAWVFVGGGGLVDTYANGGVRLIVGSSSANYKMWAVLGNDTFPYIGWQCVAVDPSLTADYTQGTPTATLQYFGAVFNCLINISKGNPMALDAIRHGRTVTVTNGSVADGLAVFSGIAGQNDTNANRWGQFQAIPGGYQLQGRLLLGTSGTAVDFRDSNVNIVTAVSLKVAAGFNAVEVQNASSRVDWDSVSWSSLGTVSRGTFTVTNNADVNITSCSFTGLSTFSLLSATDILNSIFRSCDTVTAAGANLTGSSFLTPRVAANTSAVVWDVNTDTDSRLDDTTFSKGTNAHHAIELGTTSPTTVTLNRIDFSGFNASNGQNDSTIHVKRTTGTVTINLVECTGNISYRTDGATVVLVTGTATVTITAVALSTGSPIVGARVYATAATGGPFPFDETVTITRVSSTATVAHTGHGLATGQKVVIEAANQQEYNGVHSVTVTTADEYTYTVSGTPATPATGTIKSTAVIIDGVTDSNGQISDTRSYLSSQPISGRVRKSSSAPYYKTGPFSGTVDTSAGFAVTVQLVGDE